MARIPEIKSRDIVDPTYRHIFDAIAGSRGRVDGPFAVLMNSPEVAGRVAHVGTYLRFESKLPARIRELAIITTARHWNCDLEWAVHVKLAKESGVSQEAISAVTDEAAADGLPNGESVVVRYARELLQARRVSGPLFEQARQTFRDQGVTELTALIGYYSMLACVLNAFEVEPSG
ncbi:MAG: carboxymuconolactone decarboxylase family protein [Chloroflexi bacterium]|nr:carboxymuconolactone decarboxylase family protein [Chloroflexota bacterium]